MTKLPCGHCFHHDHFKTETGDRECGGVLKWLKDHNSCPICRHELPEAEDQGEKTWICAGCDATHPQRMRRCPGCQTARNVRSAFEAHEEVFERAAALIWELRRDPQPEPTELNEGWARLMKSRLVLEIESGGWEIKAALEHIWEKERLSRDDSHGPDESWPSTSLLAFISLGGGDSQGLVDKASLVTRAVEVHTRKREAAKCYTAEEVGAETAADINSRGMIR